MSSGPPVFCWACGAAGLEPARLPVLPASLRCPACGMVRAAVTDPETVRELYGASYYEIYGGLDAGYDADPERRRYESRRRLRLIQRFARSGRLLEIGSAVGYFLSVAHEAGFTVTGVEPAEALALAARERFGVDARVGFIEDAELDPGSFDVACAWHVLEHVPEPLPVLRRVHAVLRPGGLIALEVPNIGSRQATRLGAAWPHWDPAHHVGHYTPVALRTLMKRAGFRVVLVDTLSGTAYYPPHQAWRPGALAGYARESASLRALPRRRHATKHELLRVVAVRT